MVDGGSFFCVGGCAVFFVELGDFFEFGVFALVVEGADGVGAFEEHVFKVVGKAGGFGGVVFAACPDGNGGVDAWFVVVWAHVDGQAVLERVDAGVQGVAGNGGVWVCGCVHGGVIGLVVHGGTGDQVQKNHSGKEARKVAFEGVTERGRDRD